MHEADLALVEQMAVAVIGRDHHELRAVERDVAFDQRQRSLADRAETDHHDRTVETGVQLVHVTLLQGTRFGVGYAACGRGSFDRNAATSFASAGLGALRPVALTRPRAPSSAPGCSSHARNRCAS